MNNKNRVIEDKIVAEFTSALKKKLGNRLMQTTLYGSRARGDNSAYSDYDFLIVVKKKTANQKRIIYDICFKMLDQYDSLISFLLYDEQDWRRKKRFPLGLNILKEGIEV